MTPLFIVFALLLFASSAYTLIMMWAARQWAKSRFTVDRSYTPTITVLKPVRGVDQEEYENFASFCQQDYPLDRYQVLFGALDSQDPALEIARRLQTDFPQVDVGIISEDTAPQGLNRKVCNMIQMLPHAKHEVLIICDSDMRVTPDYLRRVVAPLQQGFSAVTCPYRGHHPRGFAAIWEALGIGADFIPSVLCGRLLEGVSFAFGSTIVLPRTHLETIGGLEALKDHLADDFQVGNRIARAGLRVALSDYVVLDVLGKERFREMWDRRLRWGRTLRACRPTGYFGSFVTHVVALATLLLVLSGFSRLGWEFLGVVLVFRLVTSAMVSLLWTHDPNVLKYLFLLPVSDLLSFALFVLSFAGRTLVWRGERFRVRADGVMVPFKD